MIGSFQTVTQKLHTIPNWKEELCENNKYIPNVMISTRQKAFLKWYKVHFTMTYIICEVKVHEIPLMMLSKVKNTPKVKSFLFAG